MALSNWERLFIYDTSQQLLSQDLLTNYYMLGSQVGASLRDMVLNKQPVQPLTNPYDEAITGTLRADAAAVRQNARNVSEAASMMGIAASGVSQINDALNEMEDIIEKIDAGELDGTSTTVQDDYAAQVTKIKSIFNNTDYNGIYMLDSSQWGTEQIDSNGQVYIQAFKEGGFDITFYSVSDLTVDGGKDWDSFDETNLSSDAGRDIEQALIDDFQSAITSIQEIYQGRQSSLEFQQTELENQADLLDQAVLARRQSTSSDLTAEQLLLKLLLDDSGTLLDETS